MLFFDASDDKKYLFGLSESDSLNEHFHRPMYRKMAPDNENIHQTCWILGFEQISGPDQEVYLSV